MWVAEKRKKGVERNLSEKNNRKNGREKMYGMGYHFGGRPSPNNFGATRGADLETSSRRKGKAKTLHEIRGIAWKGM